MRTAFAVGDAPAGAKSPAFGKDKLCLIDQLFGRAHPARRSTDVGKSSLGALLREREVTGRDASLPAPLLSAFGILVARGTVGALPQTPQGTLSLDPARGNFPLDPFRAIELVSLPYSFRVLLHLGLRRGRYLFLRRIRHQIQQELRGFHQTRAGTRHRVIIAQHTWPSFTAVTSSQPAREQISVTPSMSLTM